MHRTEPESESLTYAETAIGKLNEAIRKYDPLDAPAPQQWLATDEQQRIDLVFAYHRRARISLPNDTVHAVIHVIVENQIADDKLRVQRTAQRLISEGLDRHDAIHAIGSVLAGNIHDLMRMKKTDHQPRESDAGQDPNKAYFAQLERLTAKGWLRSA